MSSFSNFRLLLWKNIKLHCRQLWFIEIGIACFHVLLIVVIRILVSAEHHHNSAVYPAYNVLENPLISVNKTVDYTVMYAPNVSSQINDIIASVMNFLNDNINDNNTYTAQPYDTEQTLITDYRDNSSLRVNNSSILCGIVFESFKNLSAELKYKLRFASTPHISSRFATNGNAITWNTDNTFAQFSTHKSLLGETYGYYEEGFMLIQHLIAIAVANITANSTTSETLFTVNAQRMPFTPYVAIRNKLLDLVQYLLPTIFMTSFIYPLVNLTKNIMCENERHIKEYIKLMGIEIWLHWLAWFVYSVVRMSVIVIITTPILCINLTDGVTARNNNDFLVIFIFFLLYSFSTIAFGFMLTTLFSKANVAGVDVAFSLMFFFYMPYYSFSIDYRYLSLNEKLVSSLLSNKALGFGCVLIAMWETNSVGVQWSNIAKPASPDDSLTMLHIWMMFVIDTILYLIIAWYVETVFSGEFGVKHKWYFVFTKSYWFGCDKVANRSRVNGGDNFSFEPIHKKHNLKGIEPETQSLCADIIIKKLSKTFYGGDTYAVKDLSLNAYNGQITVLLGHKGAGKTTTMSIITGLFPPSKGTVVVNGYDIRTDLDKVHDILGVCPQFDILFDMLTVEEHMQFFCKLKNFDPKKTDSEITRLIEILGLEDKRKAQSTTLSGGMKRKLSVGIALVGGSKIVILDEPTSGMDVSSKRLIWEILMQEKQNRTILLSTHTMEEANVLSDRIAILVNGELQCCGSPYYLKKKYGASYHLTVVKKAESIDAQPITSLIMSCVTTAEIENETSDKIVYRLPKEESYRFESLFSELETSKASLGIENYSISITTMEDVFQKVGQSYEDTINYKQSKYNSHDNRTKTRIISRNTGMRLLVQQFYGLLMKKIQLSWRNRALTLTELFLPFLLMIISLALIQKIPKPQDSPNLPLDLNNFKDTKSYVFVTNKTSLVDSFIDNYKSQFDKSKDFVHEIPINNSLNKHSIDYLLELGKNEFTDLIFHTPISVIVGTDAEDSNTSNHFTLTALYNNRAFHTPAISLSLVDHVILKLATNNPEYSFQVWNHPLPRTLAEEIKQNHDNKELQTEICPQILVSLAFLFASFSVPLVSERVNNSKQLQLLCGVRLSLFWLSSFVWDSIIYMVSSSLVTLLFLVFDIEAYKQEGPILLLFFVHGLAIIPFVYALSFLFDVPSSAYLRMSRICAIMGSVSFLVVTLTENIESVSDVFDWIFSLVLPFYCLSRAFFNLYNSYIMNKTYNNEVIDYMDWNKPGIGKQLVLLLFQAIYYWIILALIECNAFRCVKYFFVNLRAKRISKYSSIEFGEIREERNQMETTQLIDLPKSEALVVKNLTKHYGDFCAVDNISFSVRRGECFSLLGVNGAGKTTLFEMITGDEPITSGDIYVDGFDVKNSITKVQRHIGYCPQFDGLLDQMTGRETLTLFCRLRGIRNSDITHEIDDISKLLYFDMHIDKLVGKYSGGTKRKLSTAVALLGDPPVYFLDEPTTGVDPVARRCLWDALTKKLSHGTTIVLTSHSMEECEALCNRLIIMVNGKICCIGSSQQLKNKFGKGYTVLIKVSTGINPRSLTNICLQRQNSILTNNEILTQNVKELKSFMSASFPDSELKGVYNNLLHYHISDESFISLSKYFGLIEKTKDRLKIEDYSIGQTTLEQIFLSFARQQRESSES